MNFRRICVFCGSNVGSKPVYSKTAESLGLLLAQRNIELVYGGGDIGLMGVLADSVLAAGGRAIGVIPESLVQKEVGHAGLTELRIVKSMHERKAMMSDLSDGFVALPGGFGTFEEFCEVVTWSQLGIQSKPCGLLNVEGYYDPLLELFDHAVREGFLRDENRGLVLEDRDAKRLLAKMAAFVPAAVEKWIWKGERGPAKVPELLLRPAHHVLHIAARDRSGISVVQAQQRTLGWADGQDEEIVVLGVGDVNLGAAEPGDDLGYGVAVADDDNHSVVAGTNGFHQLRCVVGGNHGRRDVHTFGQRSSGLLSALEFGDVDGVHAGVGEHGGQHLGPLLSGGAERRIVLGSRGLLRVACENYRYLRECRQRNQRQHRDQ